MTTAAAPAVGYRDLLRPAHVPAFLAAALVGRLSQGVAGLATLLLVQRATGSYAVAGAAVACLGGTAAVLAPARARWVHRRGPGKALPLLAGGYGLVLAVVALAGTRLGSTPAALPALCALAGCLTPPLGPVTRTMWAAVTPQPDLLRLAYSLDAASDEVLFTIGPMVAAFAVALAGAGAGVLVTAVLAVGGSLGVAASPLASRTPVRTDQPTDGRTAAPLRAPGFARLLTVMFGVGTALGGVELVAVGLGGHGGGSTGAGMLVATVALGGVVGSIAYGRRTWRRAPGSQLGVLCVALTCALLATLAATAGPALLPVALFCSGLVVAPALVVGYGLAERLTHRSTHPEAGALVGTANNLGISVGTAVTALVLDGAGAVWALLAVAAVAAGTTAARPTRVGSCGARRAAVPRRKLSKKMSPTMSRPAPRLRPRGGCGHRGRTARRRPDMAKYLFLKHYRGAPEAVNNVPMDRWTPQEVDDHVRYMNDFAARLQSTGEFVDGQALSPEGTFVRYDGEGRPPVTDGPFAETKDLIAGWMVVDVDTYERALALAGELSAAPGAGGKPIHEWLEVRPFLHAAPTVTE